MKSLVSCIVLFTVLQQDITDFPPSSNTTNQLKPCGNLFIITLDGFRWQEVFNGADETLINDVDYTADTATIKSMYWSPDKEGRRKKLLPFFWNVIGKAGQLYGNREFDNKVNTSNLYSISYPGYNELLAGNTDIAISSNEKTVNPNITVLEYLNNKEEYKGKVCAFTSWDVFPYILNKPRSGIALNSGYENVTESATSEIPSIINHVQESIADKKATRNDELTFLAAKEYLEQHRPKVLYLGLGETDEAAHAGRYDIYLEKAAEADRMIARLWHWAQSTPGYRNNTTFIITTDHGRGKRAGSWSRHGSFVSGSSQTWLAVLGPNITALGEIKEDGQIYQRQVAQTIAALLGEKFESDQPVAAAIKLK
jgi:hypothetical protein